MITIHNIRLPVWIEVGSRGGAGFQTTRQVYDSGVESRNQDWVNQKAKYNISYGVSNKENWSEVREFFYGRRGMAFGFLFLDWLDHDITNGLIGLGDGANDTFLLIKYYEETGPNPYLRPITRPIDPNSALALPDTVFDVFIDDILVDPADYTMDFDTGSLVFDTAPLLNEVVRVTCHFFVPCAFGVDELPLVAFTPTAASVPPLIIDEVKERDQ